MDAFNFIHFLKNPAYLHQVTFQEINNLIEQYPFCQNLHYLALRKAQYEDHPDFVKKLELAATYSPNRQWLYKQLQDTPAAISDEPVSTEEELVLVETEEESIATEVADMDLALSPAEMAVNETPEVIIPTPVFYREEEPAPKPAVEEFQKEIIEPVEEEENIEDLEPLVEETQDISGETPPSDEYIAEDSANESNSEHFVTPETDNTTSHSISDSDDVPMAIETTDELDVNLENPEDMKLPDYKDRKVIFMEDLVDEVPSLEENLNDIELDENANNSIANGFSEHVDEEQKVEESAVVSDMEEEESATPDIPFEVYDARDPEEEVPLVVFDEMPSEGEAPEANPNFDENLEIEREQDLEEENVSDEEKPEFISDVVSTHLVDSDTEQLDQPAHPSDSVENKPLAAMIYDDDELKLENHDEQENEEDHQEEEIEEEEVEEVDLTEELSSNGQAEKDKHVGPLPKSAFSSWRRSKDIAPSPSKEKKKKKSKASKIVEVADLFKKDKEKKKKKKKKNSKKKDAKRHAMLSLQEQEDAISETLAEILAGQGRKKKAIKMYQRLIKLQPTKEAIYLDRIEELKKD